MAKLLQGSARVLTPTNLITNSDFELKGGRPSTQEFKGTTNSTINFWKDLQLICYGNTIVKNVKFTDSDGVLRITGMVQGATSSSHIRINDNDEFLRKNRYYTIGASMKDNLGTVQSFQCYLQNDANILYNTVLYPKGDTTNWYKPQMIEGTTVNGRQNVRFAVIYFGVTNGFIPFDVSIKEPYIYEGTFINPPFFESLDIKTRGWALANDMGNVLSYSLKNLNFGKGWLRVCHIGNTSTAFECKSTVSLWKSGGNARVMRVVITFWAMKVTSNEAVGKIEVDSYQTSNGLRFSAARFAKDSDGDIFLEVFNNIAASNSDTVYVTSIDNIYGYDSSGISGRNPASLSMYKVNDGTGDNDILLGNQVSIPAVANTFSIL